VKAKPRAVFGSPAGAGSVVVFVENENPRRRCAWFPNGNSGLRCPRARSGAHRHRRASCLPLRAFFRRPAELKNVVCFRLRAFRRAIRFPPCGRRRHWRQNCQTAGGPACKRREIFEIERREKTVGVDPDAEAFDENVAVHRHVRIQIGAEHAIVFGIHAAQIHADPRHAAGRWSAGRGFRLRFGGLTEFWGWPARKRMAAETFAKWRRNVPKSIPLPPRFRAGKTGDVTAANGDGLNVRGPRGIPGFRAFPAWRGRALSSINSQWPGGTSVTRRGRAASTRRRAEKFLLLRFAASNSASGVFAPRAANSRRRRENFPANVRPVPRASASRGCQWFRRNDFVQRLHRPRGLGAGAAVRRRRPALRVWPAGARQ
jgi:hypothetical protein